MLGHLAREGTSVPPEDVLLAGKAVAVAIVFVLTGFVASIMRWKEVEYTLYVVAFASGAFALAVYVGAI